LCIILVLFYGYVCYGNEIWYQAEMTANVVPSFQNAYGTMQQNILDKLLTTDINSLATNDDALKSFAVNLNCQIEKIFKYLDSSAIAGNNIRIKVDQKLTSITQAIQQKQNEIAGTNVQIQNVNSRIQMKRNQINAADANVRQAEAAVASATNALHNAEREVEDAKLCQGLFGRKKRFLGNIWNSIQNAVINPVGQALNTAAGAIEQAANVVANAVVDNVVKPVCSVINYSALDNAIRNVENKKNELSSFKNQVQTFKNELTTIQNELTVFNSQLYNLNYQLNELQNSLVELPNEKHVILLINQRLTDVLGHMRKFFSGSTILKDVMKTLIDFDLIMKPLNVVHEELRRNQLMAAYPGGEITIQKTNQVKINLEILIVLLGDMSFNIGSKNCSN